MKEDFEKLLNTTFEPESPALRRLIDEVRNDIQTGEINNYNRFHNRHNRSGPGARRYDPIIISPEPTQPTKNKERSGREIMDAIKEAVRNNKCIHCGNPIEQDATKHEKHYFQTFGAHKQCEFKDYVRGSE